MSGSEDSPQLGPAAAYSAAVSAWLNQVYQAQMMHYGNFGLQFNVSPSYL